MTNEALTQEALDIAYKGLPLVQLGPYKNLTLDPAYKGQPVLLAGRFGTTTSGVAVQNSTFCIMF